MSRHRPLRLVVGLVLAGAMAAGCSDAERSPELAVVVEGHEVAASETETLVRYHLDTQAEAAAAGSGARVHEDDREERAERFVLLFQIKHALLRHLAREMDIPLPAEAASPEEAAGEISRAMAERLFPDLPVSDGELRAEYDRRAASPAPFPGVPADVGLAVPSFAEVEAALRTHLVEQRRQHLFSEWFDQQLRTADIRLAERYGRWDPERAVVR